MGEDERLREALHELEVLRERERRALSETSALLDCVEAFARARGPGAATAALLDRVSAVTGAARILILEAEPPAPRGGGAREDGRTASEQTPARAAASGREPAPDCGLPASTLPKLRTAVDHHRMSAPPGAAGSGIPPDPGAPADPSVPQAPRVAGSRSVTPARPDAARRDPAASVPGAALPGSVFAGSVFAGSALGGSAGAALTPSSLAAGARILRVWPEEAAAGQGASGRIVPPVDIFDRARNVADLGLIGRWEGDLDAGAYLSLLSTPVPDPFVDGAAGRGRGGGAAPRRAICLFHRDRAGFGPAQRSLLARLAPLFGRALAGERLASDKALLAAVIEGASAGVAIADASRPDVPLVYVNAAFEALSGYPADAALGRNCRFLSAEAPDAAERARLRAAVARGEGGRFLVRNRRRDGALFWNELHIFAVRDGEGRPRHLVATQSDVTSRIDAEREAERLRQRLAQALGVIEDAVLMVDAAGQVIFRNAALVAAFPAPGLDWAPGTAFAENHAAHRATLQAGAARDGLPDWTALGRLVSASDPREARLPDGRTVLLRARRDGDGVTVLTAADVTRLKRIEAKLQLRIAAIEAAQDGILLVDGAERIVYLNGAAAALLGVACPDRALGQPWHVFYDGGAEAVRAGQSERATRQCANGRTLTHDIKRSEVSAAAGQVLVVRDVTERLAEEARQADLRAALSRAQRQDAMSQLAGGLSHDFNNLLAAINGAASKIAAAGDVSADVYDQALRIASAGQSATRLVARLRDLGAPGRSRVAVDLRDVLAGLPACAARAGAGEIELQRDPQAAEAADGRRRDAVPGQESGRDAGTPGSAPGLQPIVEADAEDLAETCLTLVRAAREASCRPAPLVLSLSCIAPDAARALPVGMLSAGRAYACLELRDAAGPERNRALAALEAALARAETRGGGPPEGRPDAGLGLAMAALQARAARGGFDIATLSRPVRREAGAPPGEACAPGDAGTGRAGADASAGETTRRAQATAAGSTGEAGDTGEETGQFTAYRLYWPLRRRASHDTAERQAASGGPSLQGATLLVVDGDREAGEVLHAFLEGLGADVALCDSAAIAAEAAREEPEAWTALIIDYDMPGMTGGELVAALRPVAPDLPVFVVTAMAERMSDPRILEAPNTRLYPRPADLGALAHDLASLPPRGVLRSG